MPASHAQRGCGPVWAQLPWPASSRLAGGRGEHCPGRGAAKGRTCPLVQSKPHPHPSEAARTTQDNRGTGDARAGAALPPRLAEQSGNWQSHHPVFTPALLLAPGPAQAGQAERSERTQRWRLCGPASREAMRGHSALTPSPVRVRVTPVPGPRGSTAVPACRPGLQAHALPAPGPGSQGSRQPPGSALSVLTAASVRSAPVLWTSGPQPPSLAWLGKSLRSFSSTRTPCPAPGPTGVPPLPSLSPVPSIPPFAALSLSSLALKGAEARRRTSKVLCPLSHSPPAGPQLPFLEKLSYLLCTRKAGCPSAQGKVCAEAWVTAPPHFPWSCSPSASGRRAGGRGDFPLRACATAATADPISEDPDRGPRKQPGAHQVGQLHRGYRWVPGWQASLPPGSRPVGGACTVWCAHPAALPCSAPASLSDLSLTCLLSEWGRAMRAVNVCPLASPTPPALYTGGTAPPYR